MVNLEQEVLEIINETIDGQYIGKLKVLHDKENGIYQLFLYFDRELVPTVFGIEGTEDEFKDFIRKEFKTRQMQRAKYYKITREPIVIPDEELMNWDDE